jgi:predicted dienelactone hydrolase
VFTAGTIAMTMGSVRAAERVELGFGPIGLGIPVSELETYAKKGRIGRELDGFLSPLSQRDRQYVRQFLSTRSDLSQRQVAQFLNSALGKKLLIYLGDLVQIDRDVNGAKAIRTGLIAAAADRQGLSVISFLRKYPTSIVRLNLQKGFEVANRLDRLEQETAQIVSGVEQLSAQLARSEPKIDTQVLPDLTQTGQYPVTLQTETLQDRRRNRRFTVDIYLPQGAPQPAPTVVFSHGLGSDRQHFAAIARHIASYGFVAVTIDHPGSNLQKFQNLLGGKTKEVFDTREFIDRPQDVSYVLDDLERRFPGLANVQRAGVVGHSFGGYTALALAGATIDFDYLTNQCRQGIDAANASLLLQCEALKLPRQAYNFRDRRISFALAINPVDSSIFGPQGMAKVQTPVAIVAGSDDTIAPAALEQVAPFTWLVAPERYLFVVRGLGHVVDARSLTRAFMPSLNTVIADNKTSPLSQYGRTFVLALVQTYVADRRKYRAYLQADYAAAISKAPNQVSILRSLTPVQLAEIFQSPVMASNRDRRELMTTIQQRIEAQNTPLSPNK